MSFPVLCRRRPKLCGSSCCLRNRSRQGKVFYVYIIHQPVIPYTSQWSPRRGTMSSLLSFVWPTHVSSPAGKSLLAAEDVCRTLRLCPFMLTSPSVALLWTEFSTRCLKLTLAFVTRTALRGQAELLWPLSTTGYYCHTKLVSLPHRSDSHFSRSPLFIDAVTFSRHVNVTDRTNFEFLKVKTLKQGR